MTFEPKKAAEQAKALDDAALVTFILDYIEARPDMSRAEQSEVTIYAREAKERGLISDIGELNPEHDNYIGKNEQETVPVQVVNDNPDAEATAKSSVEADAVETNEAPAETNLKGTNPLAQFFAEKGWIENENQVMSAAELDIDVNKLKQIPAELIEQLNIYQVQNITAQEVIDVVNKGEFSNEQWSAWQGLKNVEYKMGLSEGTYGGIDVKSMGAPAESADAYASIVNQPTINEQKDSLTTVDSLVAAQELQLKDSFNTAVAGLTDAANEATYNASDNAYNVSGSAYNANAQYGAIKV